MKKKEIKLSNIIRILFIIITAGAITLFLIYYLLNYGNSDRFPMRTYVNGTNISWMTISEANDALQTDHVYMIGGKPLNLSRAMQTDYSSDLKIVLAKRGVKDVIKHISKPLQATTTIKGPYNEELIKNTIKSFTEKYNEDKRGPAKQQIVFRDNMFKASDYNRGERIDENLLYEKVMEADETGTTTIDANDCIPDVEADGLVLTEKMEFFNHMESFTVVVDDIEEEIKKEKLSEWIIYHDGNSEFSINEDKVNLYVNSISKKYDTYQTNRVFKTTQGLTIETIASPKDTFGYKMDKESTAQAIIEALSNEQDFAEVVWEFKGAGHKNNNDIGNSYVEVSIEKQHLWCYIDGLMVLDCNVVTGKTGNDKTRTYRGVFAILNKKSPSLLKGDDYETWVEYWMPFTYTGSGFHDAPWRSSFGGEIYKTNGSHGCVNMPPHMAETLYSIVYEGMPVIIY